VRDGVGDGETPDCLVVSNDPSELTRVSAWVNAWSERFHVPERTAASLDLCATEVVTNIMTHGFTDQAAHQITLRLDRQGDRVALEIDDDGRAFDPRLADPPPDAQTLEDAEIGGWGIPLVRRFSDGWRYRRSGGRNHLTLVFDVPRSLS
jgi:serine/threonine-protein kinase RsbW